MKPILYFLLLLTVSSYAQNNTNDTASNVTADKTYRTTEVDLKPQLKEGMYTLSMFISDNFKFEKDIKNKKITIFSSFVIEPDGTMTNVKAFYVSVKDYLESNMVKIAAEDQKINEADQIQTMKGETVRVLKMFSKTWTPAVKDGKAVRCLYNYPINFNIE
jgi:protein TonB